MDMITTGRTALDRDTLTKLVEEIRGMLVRDAKGQRLHLTEIRRKIEEQSSIEVRVRVGVRVRVRVLWASAASF